MRILILGAGGIGGYFGARLHDAGGDVTFLVRPTRAAQLRAAGLQVFSPHGNTKVDAQLLTADELAGSGVHFDVVLLSCKAYDLASAIEAIAPAVGEESLVVPLLNGVRHIETLVARFGQHRVAGGSAFISVALDASGAVRHLNTVHRLVIGSLTPSSQNSPNPPAPLEPLARLLATAGFEFVLSEDIGQALWDKFVFLSTLAAATCTLRASIGEIVRTVAGASFIDGLLDEAARVAAACAHALAAEQLATYRKQLTEPGSTLMASMLRDIERGNVTEADHILGDMVERAHRQGVDDPLQRLAYSHLQAYEMRRAAANA